ncbi:MAG: SRPBCC family protein [Pyrinomonadaceae bacterium]
MIKKLLIAIGVVVVLLIAAVAAAVFMTPTDFAVEREIVINKPREEVFNYVKNVRSQSEWGPWFKREPTMKQEFRGTDGEVGFVAYWKGETDDTGEGEQEIKRIVPNERLETELRFMKPFESTADTYLTTEDAGDGKTKVKWGFTGAMPRPMNLMLLVVDMDSAIGKDYQDGLNSLKQIMESR